MTADDELDELWKKQRPSEASGVPPAARLGQLLVPRPPAVAGPRPQRPEFVLLALARTSAREFRRSDRRSDHGPLARCLALTSWPTSRPSRAPGPHPARSPGPAGPVPSAASWRLPASLRACGLWATALGCQPSALHTACLRGSASLKLPSGGLLRPEGPTGSSGALVSLFWPSRSSSWWEQPSGLGSGGALLRLEQALDRPSELVRGVLQTPAFFAPS